MNKKKFLHERGVWKEKKPENQIVSFKINKYEDKFHRRYFLKPYKDASKKDYLNLKTYRDRKKSFKMRSNSNSKSNDYSN